MNNIKSFTIFVLGILFAGLSCTHPSEQAKQPVPATAPDVVVLNDVQMTNAGIETALPQKREMQTTIRLNGTVDVPPQNLVSVSFPMGGYLRSTPLLPGYPVRKGDPIAVMQDQSFVQLQQDYLTTSAQLDFLSTDLQRQKDLSDADATSKKTYQLALSEYKTKEAILRSTAEKLRLIHIDPEKLTVGNISAQTRIYSPIDGYVSKVNVNVGKYLNPTDVLFELVNPTDIHAAMTVFEKDITLFRKGIHGKVALLDQPGQSYNVETILVTRNVNDSRTGVIHCHFEGAHRELLPGMFLSGVFQLDSRKVLAVPEDAVVNYMGRKYVFVTRGPKEFQLTAVETGDADQGFIELTSSGNPDWGNTRIAIKGAYALLGKLKNKMEDN
ncbi:efflux RND transporter periplasmic adaptor subunit [Flavitalea sp. BT771]|uniref:efflux RND transporter periplasmic adaptor subunit n=1 Tax=Flavitalea sp. BT771 TaxID=3063329 RepID=UPI0026E14BC4|nr:efflux RND transporter periplasmic adaptor subunit [Flavitalea sp. BT771]MDO6430236.1 efflux RND transporter periplasmic adaptor subunit [Flavitalea sp. BT771]MDV6219624.1 efflux RND transporter periplasmic adaptor subunit [Flavitalea sp. BT771]